MSPALRRLLAYVQRVTTSIPAWRNDEIFRVSRRICTLCFALQLSAWWMLFTEKRVEEVLQHLAANHEQELSSVLIINTSFMTINGANRLHSGSFQNFLYILRRAREAI